MKKNMKLIAYPDCKHHVKVILTPLGNKIKWVLVGEVFCERQKCNLKKSGVYSKEDLAWNAIFGSVVKTNKFLKRNRTITKVITINLLGYKPCDWINS